MEEPKSKDNNWIQRQNSTGKRFMKNPFKKLFKKKKEETNDVSYRIRVGTVREISLEELVRLCYYEKMSSQGIPLLQYANGYLLYSYAITANYGDLSHLVVWYIISESYFVKVREYKKFIFFDDSRNECEYTDDVSEKTQLSNCTCVIPVLKTQDDATVAILKRIKKQKMLEKK